MHERLGIPKGEVPALREMYYKTYGTTLKGLQIHYHVEPDEYLAFVHELPLSLYLQPNLALREILLSLPQPKWIFTNADSAHANRVITRLGLEGCFKGIIDIYALDFMCKPQEEAYYRALALAGEDSAECCTLFDDSPRNLTPALEMGFYTVLVGKNESNSGACKTIANLGDLVEVMPELWDG